VGAGTSSETRYSSPSYTRDYPLARRLLGSVVEDVDDNRYLDFAAGTARVDGALSSRRRRRH
jgi:4-aminobutyrate aminotransferase-like enzyme